MGFRVLLEYMGFPGRSTRNAYCGGHFCVQDAKCDRGLTTEVMLKSGVVTVTPVRRGRVRRRREEDRLGFVMLGHLSGGWRSTL